MTEILMASVARMLRATGTERVSRSAIIALCEYLEAVGKSYANDTATVCEHAGRKTIVADDIIKKKITRRVL